MKGSIASAVLAAGLAFFAASGCAENVVSEAKRQCKAANYQAARTATLRAVKVQPNDPILWSCLGLADSALGDFRAAIIAHKKSLSLDSKVAPEWFRLADLYASNHQIELAIDGYRHGFAIDSTNPSANENYARLLMQAGRFRESMVPLQIALKSEPESKALQLAAIDAYLHLGRTNEAKFLIDSFGRSAGIDQQLQLTSVLAQAQQFDRALTILNDLTIEHPESPEAHAQLGLILMEQEQFEKAATELGQAAQMVPTSERYSLALGEVLLRWHHYSTALEFLNNVKVRFGTSPKFQYELAYAFYGMRDFESAMSTARSLLKVDAKFAGAEFLTGNCLVGRGDFTGAEVHLRRALEQEPRRPAYYLSLAQVKRYQGRLAESANLLRKGLVFAPRNPDLLLELALCQEKQGNISGSEATLEQVVAVKPEWIEAHRALVRVYGRSGNQPKTENEKRVLAQMEAQANAQSPEPKNEDENKQ
jgi:tetratricopeptide (TPR) repeat protein